MKKKYIPIGMDNFKEIIQENYYFVDKSLLIEELLNSGPKVFLLPRPRRFGKTLNMSMLKYFFDIRSSEENRKLFHGLKIESSEYFNEQGKYPIIHISFKDIKTSTWEECLYKIKLLMEEVYTEHSYLRDSLTDNDKKNFDLILTKSGEKGDLEVSILKLSRYMEKYFNKKVIILLDEYDAPLTEAYLSGYYEKALPFFRNFMSAAFKSNIYLKFGVITGIIRIAKDSIFSGLNNLAVHSILNDKFNHFGLREEEVEELIKYYGLDYELNDVKEWYNGYLFGEHRVYNPWSILNFAYNNELKAYWIETSDNNLIKNLYNKNKFSFVEDIKKIFSGNSVNTSLRESITFNSLENSNSFWSLLFYTGYLTYSSIEETPLTDKKTYHLVIPNYEVLEFFRETFLEDISGNVNTDVFTSMMNSLNFGDISTFSEKFKELFRNSISYHDSDNSEKSYHNFVLGLLLFMSKYYVITSNRESGNGRYDIAMTPRMKNHHGIIFEFKVAKSLDKLKEQSIIALNQIEEKDYTLNMKSEGVEKIIKIGIAFSGKELEISYTDK